jgi:VCBS repeat-containing protein
MTRGLVAVLWPAAAMTTALWVMPALGYEFGITGYAGPSTPTCANGGCHSAAGGATTGSYNYTPSFTVASYMLAGSGGNSVMFSLTKVSGSSSVASGLDVSVDSGSLAAGTDTQLLSGEITHHSSNYGGTDYAKPVDGAGNNSWSFTYTAPGTTGTVHFYGCGNAVNHDLTSDHDNPFCTSMSVSIVNRPTASADGYSNVTENTAYSGSSVLSNDTQPNGSATASLSASPSHSSAFILNSDGTFSYTPTNTYFGSDSFTYRACYGTVCSSSTATVTLTINQVAPTAVADSYTNITENTAYSGSSVLGNDTDPSGTPTATLIGSPSHGSSFILNSDGTFSYTPTNAYFGSDSFTYQACHGVGHCSSTTTVSLTINQVAPTAVADGYSVNENATLTVVAGSGVLANDTDPSGTPTATLIGGPSHASSFTLNSNGSFSYVPANGYFGSDSFTYQACHGVGHCSATTTVSLTVDQLAPTAVADSYTNISENTPYSGGSVLSNDTDPNGTPTATLIGSPGHASSFTLNGNGTFNYTPANTYFGPDSFTYQACHGSVCSSTVTVSLTINQGAPTATPDNYSTSQNTTLVVPAGSGVLANDTDPSNLALTASIVSTTGHGTLTLNSDGSFTYVPTNGYHGGDGFTYSASDGTLSSSTSVSIAVGQSPPVANADGYSMNQNTTLTIAAGSGVLANDTDPSNLSLTAQIGTTPSHGSVTLSSDGSFIYTPTVAYHGTDSFTYQANDGSLTSTVATVTITVNQVAPTAAADSYSMNQNTALTITAGSGVLANDTDPSNLALTSAVVSTTGHGTLTLNSDGSFTYTPTVAYHGTDTFTYRASDGTLTANAAVTITVNQVAPTATGDSYSLNENTTLTVTAGSGVLVNDTDPSNLTLTAAVAANPAHGTLALSSNGGFTYTPASAYSGIDTFTYRAGDGTLNSTPATVTLTVVQGAPVANADSYSVNQNTTLTVALGSGVLVNDTDPSNLPLTASVVSTTSHGSLSLNADGTFTYTPTAAYHGTDTFTYKAYDGSLYSSPATVTITVAQLAPTATADGYSVNENTTLTVTAGSGVLANDTDPSNLTLTATVVSATSHGTLMLSSDGSFVYTPTAGYFGSDTFTYTASDGAKTSSAAMVTISVAQQPPVATDDSYSMNQNATLSAAAPGVLANDTDPSGLALTASVVTNPAHGALTLNSNGSFIYTLSDSTYAGSDSFTYKVSDGNLSSNTATVTITVLNVPVVTAPPNITVNAIGYLTYVDLSTSTATALDKNNGNALLVTADHASGDYRPGHYVVTYTAVDSNNVTGTATQTVDVIPLVDFGPDQTTGAGRTISVDVVLNGNAAAYPVTVAYTIGGTAAASDSNAAAGTATISSGTTATIPITVNPDNGNSPDRTIVLTLANPVNAVLDARTSTTITIVDRNVAPTVALAVTQQSQARTTIFDDQNAVTVTASATDPNAGDTVTYDWSGTDAGLSPPTTSTSSFTFNPAGLPAGSHTVKVTATDSRGASTIRTLTLLAEATAPAGKDFTDADGNGIPAYIDPYSDPSALPDQTGNPAATQPLQTDASLGLRLGVTALDAGHNGALIDAGAIGASNATDTAVNDGGVFSFEVTGVATGGTGQIVLPLQAALRSGAVYREYTASGGWRNFVSDTSDSVASAFTVNGVCPGPNSTSWVTGLNPFAQCIRLTVQDGGPNDADGVANGVIDNLGGAAVAALQTDDHGNSNSSPGGSGGVIDPALLALLAAAAGLRRHRSAGE